MKIERIISKGHQSPESGCYDQERNEWVIVLKGEAVISFEYGKDVNLNVGSYLKEALIKSGLNFSGDKMFRFKAQIAENSSLFLRFARWKRDMIALKKQFMTYSELPKY